ncbi:nitrate- and nitrite sensing domain-containing protein [Nocardia salmonicida]|uniref:sensor histidine kinase n=1 Tax=Nocardia salmonicida TaxID=53431 RepID=UPI003799A312
MFKAFRSLRARVLMIALVPSLALLAVGGTSAAYLVVEAQTLQDWADEQVEQAGPGFAFARLVQQERRLALLSIAGHTEVAAAMQEVRPQVESAVRQIAVAAAAFQSLDSGLAMGTTEDAEGLADELTSVRARVDTNSISIDEVYAFYNRFTDLARSAMESFVKSAPDTSVAVELNTLIELFDIAESISRGHDLALAAEAVGGMSASEVEEFGRQIGFYRHRLPTTIPKLPTSIGIRLQRLTESADWRKVSDVEGVLTRRGVVEPTGASARRAQVDELAIPTAEWLDAVGVVSGELLRIWVDDAEHVSTQITEIGDDRAQDSMVTGIIALVITGAAFLTALYLSRRMIQRLHRLRAETLELADVQLPTIVGALRRGESVDVDNQVTRLEFGTDEIGQVADAFNRAQLAAVNAAATEARTREGVNAVFLNIAHRSQVVLHRHLKLLDQAEHEQEDPKVLDLLFRLHHLAARERRNAENLIILGGEQPRRQWRNPVQLDELVRGAVAEAHDYFRAQVARLPEVKVSGAVIADLVHLLSELIDNATSFSPPDSRVEVTGSTVGRGVAVEVIDQGLGIPADQIARLNETLSEPPDFGLAGLSGDSRLGMFVIARLAARVGVSVRLAESAYGGVKAIVLIPAELLTVDGGESPRRQPEFPISMQPPPAAAVPTGRWSADDVTGPRTVGAFSDPVEEIESPGLIDRKRTGRAQPAFGRPNNQFGQLDHRGGSGKPELPRRQRQANLAPQLVGTDSAEHEPQVRSERTAEQARDLFSAIETGTRQGRTAPPQSPTSPAHEERKR